MPHNLHQAFGQDPDQSKCFPVPLLSQKIASSSLFLLPSSLLPPRLLSVMYSEEQPTRDVGGDQNGCLIQRDGLACRFERFVSKLILRREPPPQKCTYWELSPTHSFEPTHLAAAPSNREAAVSFWIFVYKLSSLPHFIHTSYLPSLDLPLNSPHSCAGGCSD